MGALENHMKLTDLIFLAKTGQLFVEQHNTGERTRRDYIWDKDNKHIVGMKIHKFKTTCQYAFTDIGDGMYKISKKDMKTLLENGAKLK